MARAPRMRCNHVQALHSAGLPFRRHEESAVRTAIEPSIADRLSRLIGRPSAGPRLRRPSPLPTIVIVPTRSTYLQRLRWLFGGH
jgi:hypothetical protein